jgi:hypothetical protein
MLRSRPGASLQTGGIVREAVVDDRGIVDYRESIIPSEITANLVHNAATAIKSLRTFKNATAIFETDTGRVFTINGAFTASIDALSNGEFSINIQGSPAEEPNA